MKRIDLIISVIEDCLTDFATDDYGNDYRPCCGVYIEGKHKDDCKLQQALAAARELKALKPVGEIRTIVWGGTAWSVGFVSHKKLNLRTKLYALDGVTK